MTTPRETDPKDQAPRPPEAANSDRTVGTQVADLPRCVRAIKPICCGSAGQVPRGQILHRHEHACSTSTSRHDTSNHSASCWELCWSWSWIPLFNHHLHQSDHVSFSDPAGCSSYGARHATCRMKPHAKEHTNNPVQRPNFRGHAAGDGDVTRACGAGKGTPTDDHPLGPSAESSQGRQLKGGPSSRTRVHEPR